jgi:hypothetical protein
MSKSKKSTAGIPRVTAKVIAMSEADRKAWLEKVPAAHREDVAARLEKAVAAGHKPTKGQGRKVDFQKAFAHLTAVDLIALRPVLEKAIEQKRDEAIAEIAAQEAELAARKASLVV